MMRQMSFLLLVAATTFHSAFGQNKIAIVNVTVIDGTDHPPRTNATVIVQGKEIEAITIASRNPKMDAKIVDGTGESSDSGPLEQRSAWTSLRRCEGTSSVAGFVWSYYCPRHGRVSG